MQFVAGVTLFDEVRRFADDTGLYEVQVTVLTPFPGTPLYTRLAREGRLIEDGRWDLCTLFDVNFRPAAMTPDELRAGLHPSATSKAPPSRKAHEWSSE